LRKAEKEIEECKRLGKRMKHRGLKKIEPKKEEAKDHISKAEENLQFALSLDKNKYGYIAISSLFYCIYHCFLAIATKFGYESGNQTCTVALIEYLKEEGRIDLDNTFIDMLKYKDDQKDQEILSLIDMREEYTYGAEISVADEKIKYIIEKCREIIEITKSVVYSKN
jgi:uncharacterized protein (UPF0332 family)